MITLIFDRGKLFDSIEKLYGLIKLKGSAKTNKYPYIWYIGVRKCASYFRVLQKVRSWLSGHLGEASLCSQRWPFLLTVGSHDSSLLLSTNLLSWTEPALGWPDRLLRSSSNECLNMSIVVLLIVLNLRSKRLNNLRL